MSQNRSPADQGRVREGLALSADPADRSAAAAMPD
jgi:predicted FMN-binding regulatory protein PaiB